MGCSDPPLWKDLHPAAWEAAGLWPPVLCSSGCSSLAEKFLPQCRILLRAAVSWSFNKAVYKGLAILTQYNRMWGQWWSALISELPLRWLRLCLVYIAVQLLSSSLCWFLFFPFIGIDSNKHLEHSPLSPTGEPSRGQKGIKMTIDIRHNGMNKRVQKYCWWKDL